MSAPPTLPANFFNQPPSTQPAPQGPPSTLPPDFFVKQPVQSVPPAAAPPSDSQPPSMLSSVGSALKMAVAPLMGGSEALGQTVAGVARPIESAVGASSRPVSGALQNVSQGGGTPGERLGQYAENIAEFGAGGEGVKGAANLLKLAERAPELLATIEKFPKASRILLSTLTNAGVGAAQGAAKASGAGAAPTEVAKAAGEEAAGAGALTAAGEGLAQLFKPAESAAAEAEASAVEKGRKQLLRSNPAGMTPKTLDNIGELEQTGHMAEIAKSKPSSYADAYKATAQHMSDFFDRTVKPALDRQGDVGMSLQPVADAVNSLHNPAIESVLPENMKAIDKSVERFAGKDIPVKDAYQLLVDFNAMTRNLAKMAPADQAAAENQAAAVASLSTATDALRSNLYQTLNTLGEHGIADAQRQYGAMAGFRDMLGKNVIRAEKADANAPGYIEGLLKLVTRNPVYTGLTGTGLTVAGLETNPAVSILGAGAVAAADIIKTMMERAGTPNALLSKAFEEYAEGPRLGTVTTRGPAGASTGMGLRRLLGEGTPAEPESARQSIGQRASMSSITDRSANGGIATPVPEGSPGTGPSGSIPNQGPIPFTRLLGAGAGESGPHAMPPSPLAPGAGSEPTPTGGARGYTSEPQPKEAIPVKEREVHNRGRGAEGAEPTREILVKIRDPKTGEERGVLISPSNQKK